MRAELTIAVLTMAEPMLHHLLEDRRPLIYLELVISQKPRSRRRVQRSLRRTLSMGSWKYTVFHVVLIIGEFI